MAARRKHASIQWPKHDLFAYNPTYEWTSYKTHVGMFLSYLTISFILFYVFLTTRDYVVRPPELVSQGDVDLLQVVEEIPFALPRIGLRVAYTNESDPSNGRIAATLENNNPYVRFHFRHVVMRNQERTSQTELAVQPCIVSSVPSLCPVVNATAHVLQGTFYKSEYKFLEISIDKCTDDPNNCANLTEINDKMHSGEFRIRAQVGVEAQLFDVERFHETGTGSVISNRSMEFFGLPDLEVQSDIVLKARKVSKKQRYAGSPPMPETETNILSFDRKETTYRPRSTRETNLLTFVVRLDDNVRLEEVNYWCPSILDLLGLWGAMASFVASLSFGLVAATYNRWSFRKHFRKMTDQKRQEARLLTISTMEWIRKQDKDDSGAAKTRKRQDIYESLQHQHDALMVESDIRLFESHHFDKEGRVAMSPAELKFPSTAFGELRRIAILEHGKKKRAAAFLSLWYARHLVKRGFVKDADRKQAIFGTLDHEQATETKNYLLWSSRGRCFPPVGAQFRQSMRRRKSHFSSRPSIDSRRDDDSNHRYDLEAGVRFDYGETTDDSNSQTVEVPKGSCADNTNENDNQSQQKALAVIAALDPVTKTA